jgi:hypothetical protein
LQELGVGGGGGDLVQHPDLVFDANEGPALMDLFVQMSHGYEYLLMLIKVLRCFRCCTE